MRLLVDLQQVSEIVQALNGCLEPDVIAKRTTDCLVEKFGCAFARIWLIEPDRITLRLVASSGMYTHTNGSFARVPMGAFKVGKIAQNRIPFLSNNLADEPWVKDRDWAIAQSITGFAGYPLAIAEKTVGVLAVFSHQPLSPEFLEAMQGLCTTLTVILENTMHYQQERQTHSGASLSLGAVPLSEQLAGSLGSARFSLVGTERSLPVSLACILLRTAELLRDTNCTYCRLMYEQTHISLEAVMVPPAMSANSLQEGSSIFDELLFTVSCIGGTLDTLPGANQQVIQLALKIPYPTCRLGTRVRVHCRSSVLQIAFTRLTYLAGLTLCSLSDATIPLLTDDATQVAMAERVLWITQPHQAIPKGISARVSLSISPGQLQDAVDAVADGKTWGLEDPATAQPTLSEREQEILSLLAQGLRDRDIANQLHISERTVKFHINNTLTKLKARTRCQAIHQAALNGCLSATLPSETRLPN